MIVDDGDRISIQSSDDNSVGPIIPVSRDLDCFAGGDGVAACDGKSGEGLDGESRVGGRTALDELCGNGVDFVDSEGGIECSGDGVAFVGSEEVSVVAGLDGKNRSRGSEIILVGDQACCSEIRADTNTNCQIGVNNRAYPSITCARARNSVTVVAGKLYTQGDVATTPAALSAP